MWGRGAPRLYNKDFTQVDLEYITKLCRIQVEVIQNHENEHRGIGKSEARHRKYKRLKLGGGQAYDRTSDQAAVVA
jgi:hypothetical protein